MANESKNLCKVGGVSFIASGCLFLLHALFATAAGAPPSSGVEIVAWVESNKIILSFINEVLFFATVLLVPSVAALYLNLAEIDRNKAIAGCGIVAATIPVLMVLLVAHGRLVYPVYGISAKTPDAAMLMVALFYGGLHAINIMFGVATFILSLAMRYTAYGSSVVVLGFVAAICDVIGAYPYVIGPALTFLCQVVFAAWLVAVGWSLIRIEKTGAA